MLTMWVAGQAVSVIGVVLLGSGVGFVAGMFGVGGGFLLTPLLSVAFGIPLPIAIGTGLCQMIGTALVALLRHRAIGQGEIRFDLLMLPGCLLGVDAGTRLLASLAAGGTVAIGGRTIALVTLVVDALYVTLLAATALLFWRQGGASGRIPEQPQPGALARLRLGPAVDLPHVPLRQVSAIVIAEIGLGLGLLSGLLGIGGGVALMPVLIYGFGFPIRQAAGTGIFVLLATALLGTALHAQHDHVDLRLAMALLVGSTISAQLGALSTRRLSPRTLRRVFAFILLATAAAVLWDLSRRFG